MNFINEQILRTTIETLKPDGELFEVRILNNEKRKPISGYFTNVDDLLKALNTVGLSNTNIYITLQGINSACAYRNQWKKFVAGASTTSDGDVDRYHWLFIDMDPVRPSGISSSEEELQATIEMAKKVKAYMRRVGFYDPVTAISGNGSHLLYKIDLENNEDNRKLIKDALIALGALFNNDAVKIDAVNFNPSRICKLYGTLAQKGTNSIERPYRMSKIGNHENILVNSREIIEKLVDENIGLEPVAKMIPQSQGPFDIVQWMDTYGLSYKEVPWSGGAIKYVLDECPFDSSHRSPDSCIIKQASGAIGFRCLHNSCRNYTWRDVRLKYEPDAYKGEENDARIEAGYKEHNRDKTNITYKELSIVDNPTEPMFLTAKMINALPTPEEEYIRTGVSLIDKRMKGLKKTAVSCMTGLRGAAKSTLLNQFCLTAIEDGHNVLCYSGELPNKSLMKWMYLQAAGRLNVTESEKYPGSYYTTKDVNDKIAEWMADRFWLYNNDYGSNFRMISSHLRDEIERHKADLVVLDNLMALDLSDLDRDKYEAQTEFVLTLCNMAKLCNVHIVFVAHPRKALGFLRLDDVGGSGNLTNAVDNAFIVHRNNSDFKRLTNAMYGWKEDNVVYSGTNVIEVAKNRDDGVQDYFIPLWYEPETKRLRNNSIEQIVYGWDNDGFIPAESEDVPW